MKSFEPAQRIRRWHTYLVVWTVHRLLGIGFGALILLASVTGGLLGLHHELESVIERDRHTLVAPDGANRLPIAALVRAVAPLALSGTAIRFLRRRRTPAAPAPPSTHEPTRELSLTANEAFFVSDESAVAPASSARGASRSTSSNSPTTPTSSPARPALSASAVACPFSRTSPSHGGASSANVPQPSPAFALKLPSDR